MCLLSDFGVGKCLSAETKFAQTYVGSTGYFSPEIIKRLPYDQATDIWSLGCLLQQMCTLQNAFKGNSTEEIERAILNDQPAPIPAMYSKGLRRLCVDLLEKLPEDRIVMEDILVSPIITRNA